MQFVWAAQLGPMKDWLGVSVISISLGFNSGSSKSAADADMNDEENVVVMTEMAAAKRNIIERLVVMTMMIGAEELL